MHGLLRVFHDMLEYCFRMSFFGRGNWQRGHRRPQFSIHFDVDSQELNYLFQVGFFNLVGHGILQPRPERPPFQPLQKFSGICVPLMCLCSQNRLPMMVGKRLSINLLLITMVGLLRLCHYPLLHRQKIQMLKLIMFSHPCSLLMQLKG
jgi:hypothetical protein